MPPLISGPVHILFEYMAFDLFGWLLVGADVVWYVVLRFVITLGVVLLIITLIAKRWRRR